MVHWIYSKNDKNTHRYALGETGERIIACLGINPSTASPEKLDRTMESVKRIANNNGYDGWLMFNVYSQRATKPEDLDQTLNNTYHQENLNQIRNVINEFNIQTLWLAFGDLIEFRSYLINCLYDIYLQLKPLELKYVIVQEPSIKGHPKHPLYKPASSCFNKFDFDQYIHKVIRPLLDKK